MRARSTTNAVKTLKTGQKKSERNKMKEKREDKIVRRKKRRHVKMLRIKKKSGKRRKG